MVRPTGALPLLIDVTGWWCAVVGGGPVAGRRVARLVEHSAKVRVISPQLSPPLSALSAAGRIADLRERTYRDGDLDGCALAVAATDDRAVNRAVRAEAGRRGILCNVADDSDDGDVLFPALVERGRLSVAIATGGASPSVTRRIRELVDGALGPEWEPLVGALAELRPAIKRRFPDLEARRAAVDGLLTDRSLAAFAADPDGVRALVEQELGLGAR